MIFSEHVQPVGTSVKWFYASQYKQKVYRSAYSGGVHVVRYEPWLQVRNYQSSVTFAHWISPVRMYVMETQPFMLNG